jgi:hypothetical protein
MDRTNRGGGAAVGSGDAFITDNLISSANVPLQRNAPNVLSMVDLCQLIESAIMYERLVTTGLGSMTNPLGEKLQEEGIVVSPLIAPERTGLLPMDAAGKALFNQTLATALQNIEDAGVFGALPLLADENTAVEVLEGAFYVSTRMAGLRSGTLQADDKVLAMLEARVTPLLEKHATYGRLYADLAQMYEIPVYRGAAEQPVLGPAMLKAAVPDPADEMLCEKFGEHYMKFVGSAVEVIWTPPLAGSS